MPDLPLQAIEERLLKFADVSLKTFDVYAFALQVLEVLLRVQQRKSHQGFAAVVVEKLRILVALNGLFLRYHLHSGMVAQSQQFVEDPHRIVLAQSLAQLGKLKVHSHELAVVLLEQRLYAGHLRVPPHNILLLLSSLPLPILFLFILLPLLSHSGGLLVLLEFLLDGLEEQSGVHNVLHDLDVEFHVGLYLSGERTGVLGLELGQHFLAGLYQSNGNQLQDCLAVPAQHSLAASLPVGSQNVQK